MQLAIGLVIGNGFSLSLQQSLAPQLDKWHPSHPLSWCLTTPGRSDTPLLISLPRFAKAITETKRTYPHITDFQVFDQILHRINEDSINNHHLILKAEMRHFLAIAYSHFQLEVNSHAIDNWSWVSWFKRNCSNFVSIISFNYDLILERLLHVTQIPFHRIGIYHEHRGIPVLKPHGSIDFEVLDVSHPVTYPLKTLMTYTNSPRRCLKEDELLHPRTEVDIVLPKEYSPFLKFQWVHPGYEWFNQNAWKLTHCYFIGLSYSHADRPEINFLLDCIQPQTEIIYINPDPPKEFIEAAYSRNLRVRLVEPSQL